MKKCLSSFAVLIVLLTACKDVSFIDSDIDLSGPCKESFTDIDIKAVDFYTDMPLANQKFKLIVQEIFSSPQTLKELVTSDSGSVHFTFNQDPENPFNNYWIDQTWEGATYIALSRYNLSPGCKNVLNIPMKKAGNLLLTLSNKSLVAHGKCQLIIRAGVSETFINIDTLPMGYTQTFQAIKLPEERLIIQLYELKTIFKQQDTLLTDKSSTEAYTMVLK